MDFAGFSWFMLGSSGLRVAFVEKSERGLDEGNWIFVGCDYTWADFLLINEEGMGLMLWWPFNIVIDFICGWSDDRSRGLEASAICMGITYLAMGTVTVVVCCSL